MPGGVAASSPAAGAFGHFRDVRQEFPRAGQDPLVAIAEVSFDLEAGTLVTLLGPSGCGKTTFLKIVGGLIRASSGIVQINGVDVTEPQPDFGIAFQQSNLMPWRSVLRNVLFPMEIRRENDRAALRSRDGAACAGRSAGLREVLSGATLGRHAAAGGAVPCARSIARSCC